jgi:predicted alpha/beta-hydrolase family hydrolase
MLTGGRHQSINIARRYTTAVGEDAELLIDGAEHAGRTLVLAHGAGAPMDSPFMQQVAQGLARGGLRVVRFEFPYMQERRSGGRRRAPDPEKVLRQRWLTIIERLGGGGGLVIGGKSLGGRMASMVADEAGVAGLVALGYPFHPPGRPERLRTAHLQTLRTPALIVQGERDPFGTREEVAGFELSRAVRLVFLEDGDHSFKPRASSGRTLADNMAQAIVAVAEFVRGQVLT